MVPSVSVTEALRLGLLENAHAYQNEESDGLSGGYHSDFCCGHGGVVDPDAHHFNRNSRAKKTYDLKRQAFAYQDRLISHPENVVTDFINFSCKGYRGGNWSRDR